MLIFDFPIEEICKVKVKLSLFFFFLTEHHAMKAWLTKFKLCMSVSINYQESHLEKISAVFWTVTQEQQ